MNPAGFQRFTQYLQHVALELRQFVEKQHAVHRHRYFTGARNAATADQRHAGGGVVRRAEAAPAPGAGFKASGQAEHGGRFQRLVVAHGRQQAGQALGQHGLAAAGRAAREGVEEPRVYERRCNYFNSLDNCLDEVHVAFTHQTAPCVGRERVVTERRDTIAAVRRDAVLTALDGVPGLDDDRTLRALLALVDATVRTNAYRTGDDGAPTRPVLAYKFDASKVPDLPLPRPMFEIWVCSPEVEGVHLRNVNFGRDWRTADGDVIDCATAEAGYGCPRCDGTLGTVRGIEMGHVFRLDYTYTNKMNVTVQDASGGQLTPRSEERRVGKECRSRWSPYH